MKRLLSLLIVLSSLHCFSQTTTSVGAARWVDSVFKSLNEDQRIAQLMVVRMASLDGRRVVFYEKEVKEAIAKYNVGGVCLFQGGPTKQASLINEMQAIAKTPLFISIDAENGLGMRMDSIVPLPRQMMMGAIDDPSLIYEYGRLVGEQCRRMGIQINYAPVVDINNNPANPVINDRSFGEDKYKVAMLGIQYMRGMQDAGVMACAKHFPGHGDVSVDSHYDLPVVNKSKAELDSLELYPFRQIVKAGVGAVMVAHLSIPSLERKKNVASSLSYNNVTELLRNDLGHKGLIITDALDMQGVAKFFQPGELSAMALEAGNDMLCLTTDIPGSITKIKESIKKKKLTWYQVNEHVKKVLYAKYQYGLSSLTPVNLTNLVNDLNAKTGEMHRQIAQRSITLLRNEDQAIFPLAKGRRIAYVGIGLSKDNEFAKEIRDEYDAHVYYFDYTLKQEMVKPMLDVLRNRYDVVIVGVHRFNRFPANNFGISDAALSLIDSIQWQNRTITMVFGNPYAIKEMCKSRILVACYQDDEVTHQTAIDVLGGRFIAKGRLPVTVCPSLKVGDGIVFDRLLQQVRPADLGFTIHTLSKIDSIVNDAIHSHAIPGAVVLVAKDGKIAYERAFGYLGYDSLEPVYPETIYDLASVTKILATTISVMKLYDDGKLDINKTIGDYLPWTKGSNKEHLLIRDILLHQAGLQGWIPFYRETLDSLQADKPSDFVYATTPDSIHMIRVAENIYLRRDWRDTMYNRILMSAVGPLGTYIYSDLDFIFLGKIVEQISGLSLDQYAEKTFYDPLKLTSTAFRPREHFALSNIAPTEAEPIFRRQLLRGDVHDPGAAMFGGVSGHAGLFSNAYDIAVLCQMLLNGGTMNGIRFFKRSTVDYFTDYHANSRRGLGFDKPERDNYIRSDPYPTLSASPQTFGHTGFTGTCIWIDPSANLIYIFLSNRVYNNGDMNRFLRMNVRPKVHELIYQSLSPLISNYAGTTTDTPNL
jgi:beta-N-acetylhexosaminidase